MPFAVGQTVSHYTILAPLGSGGMGMVYKARDFRLDRLVALKFLPPELTRDPEAKQLFIHEARSSSSLQHQNICVVYDIDETDDGQMFISMECLEGDTLEQRLKSGPLPIEQAIDIASQTAEGLMRAHEAGIIHRDLKPANIIITPAGVPKILDFGVARSTGHAPALLPGSAIIGTAAYMSPEQARGEPVDQRTDIWSLGAILYEMVTGRRPFGGEYDQAMLYAVTHEKQIPASAVRPETPPQLERLIDRCLEKLPASRMPNAQTLLTELRTLTRSPAKAKDAAVRTVAVLPFADISPEKDNAYFSDGLTEEIIAKLSRLRNLRIVSRTTALNYDRTGKTIHQIGSDLGAQFLLEGSVRKHNTALRITTQLIDASQDSYLWAETYDGTTGEIFDIQENVAARIVKALRLRLTPNERRNLKHRATQNTEAYQLYLRGRFFWNKRSEDGLLTAIRYFEQAIEVDPHYALAWAGIADAYTLLTEYGTIPRDESSARSKAAVRKALELDDRLAEAHASLGTTIMINDWNWRDAEKELKLAVRLDPTYATGHHWYAEWLSLQGRHGEAIAEIRRAAELDPLSPAILKDHGIILYYARDYDGAIEFARKTLEIDPDFANAHRLLSLAYMGKGMFSEAIAENQLWVERSGKRLDATAALAYCYAVAGRKDEALRAIEGMSEDECASGNASRNIALVYAALGNVEEAITWLERAYEKRADALGTLRVDPKADPLRADPRFDAILKKVGLVE